MTISTAFFGERKDRFRIRISLKFVPKGPVDNKPALFQVMAWRRKGDSQNPIHMTRFTDAYMRNLGGGVGGGGGVGEERADESRACSGNEVILPLWGEGPGQFNAISMDGN